MARTPQNPYQPPQQSSGLVSSSPPSSAPRRAYDATNPVQAERAIAEGADALDGLVDALSQANNVRYATEDAWKQKMAARIDYWMVKGFNATHARARATVEAQPEYREYLQAKAEWHYLDDLRQATQTRLFGLMNINKAVTAAYQGTRG